MKGFFEDGQEREVMWLESISRRATRLFENVAGKTVALQFSGSVKQILSLCKSSDKLLPFEDDGFILYTSQTQETARMKYYTHFLKE